MNPSEVACSEGQKIWKGDKYSRELIPVMKDLGGDILCLYIIIVVYIITEKVVIIVYNYNKK